MGVAMRFVRMDFTFSVQFSASNNCEFGAPLESVDNFCAVFWIDRHDTSPLCFRSVSQSQSDAIGFVGRPGMFTSGTRLGLTGPT